MLFFFSSKLLIEKSHKIISSKCITRMSHQNVSSEFLIRMSHPNVSISYKNFSSKRFIKMSHQNLLLNVSSTYFIRMLHQNISSKCFIKLSHQNVSSKCLIKCLIKFLMGKFLALPSEDLKKKNLFLKAYERKTDSILNSYIDLWWLFTTTKKINPYKWNNCFWPLLGFWSFLKKFFCVFSFLGKINFSQSPKLYAQV